MATAGPQTAASGLPWGIRAIQMDLARHMETVDYIRHYTDLAADQGFNTLVLYLEARVRTPSFPFRPPEETYSLDEMADVVGHARGAGLDVVPVVSTLGHAEQFFACNELAHMAEQRDGRARWGAPSPSIFCPSLDATYEFFATYFAEMGQVFTAPHWHAGLDEDWDVGYCTLCRARWEEHGLGPIFADHIRRVERILAALGKRMWMWDDMFEFFPEELANIPNSIVMCHWQYDELIEPEGIQAHFANRARRNWLAEYERLGIDAIVCPASGPLRNVATFTDYARRHAVLGGLLTQWEGSPRFHAGNALNVAFTGRLWRQQQFDPQEALEQSVGAALPSASPSLAAAVRELIRTPWTSPHGSVQSYLQGGMAREEVLRRAVVRLALAQHERSPAMGQSEVDLLDHLEWSARMELLHWELRELIPAIYDPRRPASDVPRLARRAEAWRSELARLLELREAWADRLRFHDHPSDARDAQHWPRVAEGLQPAWDRLEHPPGAHHWWAVLRLFLQDFFGAPRLKVSVVADGRDLTIIEGTLKPPSLGEGHTGGHYSVMVPFEAPQAPEAIRLEGWGYGGQGVAFVELQSPTTTLLPCGIRTVSGPVAGAQAALHDDSAVAFLGCPDVAAAIHHPMLAEQRAVLDLRLG